MASGTSACRISTIRILSAPLNLRRKKQQKKRRKSRTYPAYRNRARNRLRLFEPSPTPQPEPSPGPTPEPTPAPTYEPAAATSVWGDVAPAAGVKPTARLPVTRLVLTLLLSGAMTRVLFESTRRGVSVSRFLPSRCDRRTSALRS